MLVRQLVQVKMNISAITVNLHEQLRNTLLQDLIRPSVSSESQRELVLLRVSTESGELLLDQAVVLDKAPLVRNSLGTEGPLSRMKNHRF